MRGGIFKTMWIISWRGLWVRDVILQALFPPLIFYEAREILLGQIKEDDKIFHHFGIFGLDVIGNETKMRRRRERRRKKTERNI